MPMFSRVAADTEPLAQSSSAGPPQPWGRRGHQRMLPGPASRAEQSSGGEAARYRAHRGYGTVRSPFALMY